MKRILALTAVTSLLLPAPALDKDAKWIHCDRCGCDSTTGTAHYEGCAVIAETATEGTALAYIRAAAKANGYVVVPRHLLDALLAATSPDDLSKYLAPTREQRIFVARSAVVEAVGPTREDH